MIDPTDYTPAEPVTDEGLIGFRFDDGLTDPTFLPDPDPLPELDQEPLDEPTPIDEPLDQPTPETEPGDTEPTHPGSDEAEHSDSEHSVPVPHEDTEPVIIDPAAEPEEVTLDDGIYGDANEWTSDWFFQGEWGYCGPTSVAIIINEFMDADITDPEQLANRAAELGLVDDISQGMYMSDLHTLLEDAGVPAEHRAGSMDELQQLLGDGYGVIVAVDSGEIWGDAADAAGEDNMPDHALVITEIDTNNGTVTLADPGVPDGNNYEVPIEVFEDAWEDSGYDMIATEQPDEDLVGAGEATVSAGGRDGHSGFALVNLAGPGRIQ